MMKDSAPLQSVILVTGGYGLLGSRVIPFLAQNIHDCQIIVVGREGRQGHWKSQNVKALNGDLRDENLWAGLPDTITHVVHLAAVIPWKAEEKYKASVVTDNLLPLANLLEHGQRWPNLQQIIYSSSISVYAQTAEFLDEDSPKLPANLYGAAKLAGEELLRCLEARGVRVVSLRLSSLYADGQYEGTVLPIMVKRALHKQDILIFGDGTRTQDFLHCEDAARAILLSFQKEAQGVFNVGTGNPITMTVLAQTISRVFADGKANIIYQPAKADNDSGIKLDISRARRGLNYEPLIQLEKGLEKLKKEMESIKE
jgi:UDP-glucose 4-epimerase